MGMFMKTLRMTVSVFALVLASVAPSAAQTSIHVTGNTTFTVTWSGVKEGATLLAQATFTVSEWNGSSFKMTVTNVQNTMPLSPPINARLTAFGFGLTPEATFTNQVPGSIYRWAFTNFPAFQRVDVCLTSGSNCAGGGSAGLGQGESSPEIYSLTISGAFTNGATIMPIPAKFQTALGSLETDGVIIDPPPPGAPDLTIAKTHNPDVAIPGGTVTYTVTVSNVGTGPSSGPATVTETPPPGLTVTALSGTGWACTVATRTCTRSDALAPGASYPPITVATSVATGATSGVNTAVVSGGGDSNSSNNTATDPTVIAAPLPGMDLTIAKSHSPQEVVPGQTFTYTIAVLNVGGTASSGPVTVTETPPAGLTVTALAGSGWSCTVATPSSTCTRSDALAAATSYPDITVTTSVGAGVAPGTLTNTAVVSGGGDTNTGNNTATDPTVITAPAPVGEPNLTLLKTPSAGSVAPGQTITFTIRVQNVGSGPTSGSVPVTVTDTPPANLTVIALSGSGWICAVPTRTCLRADVLAPGGSYPEITVTAVVAADATGTVVNGAVVTGGGDTDPGNGTGTGPIEVDPPVAGSDLAIVKTRATAGAIVPGQQVTFTVRVTNVGGSSTSGTVTVTENPPAGLTVTGLSGTGWTCTVASRTCTRADVLAPATSYPDITVTATVGVAAVGTLVNGAAVSGGGDSGTDNNTAVSPIEVNPLPVPTLPVFFVIALLSALLAIALLALRARRGASL